MIDETPPLKFSYENHDFCRVVFTMTRDGHENVYCWQEDAPLQFKFYRCSSGGGFHEPSHEVLGWHGVRAKDATPRNPGMTQTGRALNFFLGMGDGA